MGTKRKLTKKNTGKDLTANQPDSEKVFKWEDSNVNVITGQPGTGKPEIINRLKKSK